MRQASVPFPPRIPDFWVAVPKGLAICKNMWIPTDVYNCDLSIWHIRLTRDWYSWEIASADAIHGETLAFTHVTPWGLAVFRSRTVRQPPRGLHGEMLWGSGRDRDRQLFPRGIHSISTCAEAGLGPARQETPYHFPRAKHEETLGDSFANPAGLAYLMVCIVISEAARMGKC